MIIYLKLLKSVDRITKQHKSTMCNKHGVKRCSSSSESIKSGELLHNHWLLILKRCRKRFLFSLFPPSCFQKPQSSHFDLKGKTLSLPMQFSIARWLDKKKVLTHLKRRKQWNHGHYIILVTLMITLMISLVFDAGRDQDCFLQKPVSLGRSEGQIRKA